MNMQRSGQRRTRGREPLVPPGFRTERAEPLASWLARGSGRGPEKGQETSSQREEGDGVYVISVAARLLHMHPQTLRKYERVGLVVPSRSIGMLRLYSAEDILRLRLIKYMVEDLRMNLAGVEFALNFLNSIMGLRERIRAMAQASALHRLMVQEIEEMLGELGASFPENPQGV